MTVQQAGENKHNPYTWVIIAIGCLWLLLAAMLLGMRQRTTPHVEITWETATEQGTAGFSLYRSESTNGEFAPINGGDFIESRGGPVTGASYSYLDRDVVPGTTYFYVLEEIEANGSRHRYDDELFEFQVPAASNWTFVLAAICIMVGLAMIFLGLKEGRI